MTFVVVVVLVEPEPLLYTTLVSVLTEVDPVMVSVTVAPPESVSVLVTVATD